MNSNAAISDAELALELFVRNPHLFGGMVLRGAGPARDAMVARIQQTVANICKIPPNIDRERLLGGLDLTATLATGRGIMRNGLLQSARGGVAILPMAERTNSSTAAYLAQAMDGGDVAAILLDDGLEADEIPPSVLTERAAFHCDVSQLRALNDDNWPSARPLAKVAPLTDEQYRAIAATALAFGIASARPLIFVTRAAAAHAALFGRRKINDADIEATARLVLAPRATRLPQMETPPEPEAAAPEPETGEHENDNPAPKNIDLEDLVLDAVAAAIPPYILDHIEGKTKRGGKAAAGRAGEKQKSAMRGRPLSSRAGVPGHGKRLALIDTLRAAAPWQMIRRTAARDDDQRIIHIRKSDLRVRAFEQRSESLTIFAVDASGSSALSRLAEAKGAVEMMLAQAYVKRSQVALIAFRQAGAEILLPPTRSLTRARRALAALPGGGGTPLAAGLSVALTLAEAGSKRGQTPTIAMLTDGKANVALDGTANRETASIEAQSVAKTIALAGVSSIVIDISPRPREEAAALAVALCGRYLPLPYAQSAAMVAAIESL